MVILGSSFFESGFLLATLDFFNDLEVDCLTVDIDTDDFTIALVEELLCLNVLALTCLLKALEPLL